MLKTAQTHKRVPVTENLMLKQNGEMTVVEGETEAREREVTQEASVDLRIESLSPNPNPVPYVLGG